MAIGIPTQRDAQVREFGSAALVTPAFTPAAGSLLLLIAESDDLTITGHDTLSAWVDVTPAGMTALRLYAALVGGSPSLGIVSVDDTVDSLIAFRLFEITGFGTQTNAASCLRSDFTYAYDTVHSIDLGAVSKMTMAFFRYGGEKPVLDNTEISPDLMWNYGGRGLVAEYAPSGDSVHTATITSNYTMSGIALELIDGVAANSAPVVNDQTFSVADSASIGTVIGTVVATDSDGTVDSYAISGTTLAINSTTGQITLAGIPIIGLVAGTPITATVTVTDNDGDTDTATVTVNVTNSGLSFSCYDADSSNAAITSETLSHVRVLDPSDLSEVATATSIATSSTGSAEIDTDSVTIGTDYLVIARRSNGDVCEPFSVTASDLAAS